MTKRMLIDSTHAEETRVVVLDGNRLEDYDVETSTKQQLKGNIYLAKIVRVEPSLQAAFVEFGGGRHGFLAFGEIHPDYYQIPVADRKRLLDMQEAEAREEEEEEEREATRRERGGRPTPQQPGQAQTMADELAPATTDEPAAADALTEAAYAEQADPEATPETTPEATPGITFDDPAVPRPDQVAQAAAITQDILVAPEEARSDFPDQPAEPVFEGADLSPEGAESLADGHENASPAEAGGDAAAPDASASEPGAFAATAQPTAAEDDAPETQDGHIETIPEQAAPEHIGGELDTDDRPERRQPSRFLRSYKIQEVMRRRQILLVQVVKEERGTKGAALTTYISLAGRFSVLMPNSPRGGGISRKITSAADRRRLKEITAELELPRGMGLIVRTAGAARPKPEILRDCEYLLNLWDQIRDTTMRSMAPTLIYEEASLIKRAIRDVYSRDVEEILVDGDEGWRAARDFMRMLMPAHAKKVQLWRDPQPLFAKAQVESQLDAMMQPSVQLRSGGYLVINQTEALVAIDVNSGRSTRERGIEETAVRTNLEAAEEAARQLRLRDLAGLIVIDFIDMESRRNNTAVEKRLKDALKNDRARIQVGSISHFGLLEMSRQRLRPSLAETNSILCPHCGGTGHLRSTESAALAVLRGIEDEGGRRRSAEIVVHVHGSIALYILNHKRARLAEIEQRAGLHVVFQADETLVPPQMRIEKIRALQEGDISAPAPGILAPEPELEDPDDTVIEADDVDADAPETPDTAPAAAVAVGVAIAAAAAPDDDEDDAPRPGETAEEGEQRQRKRRRRRRSGRRDDALPASSNAASPNAASPNAASPLAEPPSAASLDDAASTAGPAQSTAPTTAGDDATTAESTEETLAAAPADADEAATQDGERKRRGRRGGRRRRREPGAPDADADADAPTAEPEPPAPVPTYVPEPAYHPGPTYSPVMYTGPTPANPFGGDSNAFAFFDAVEEIEPAPVRPAPVSRRAPEPATPEPAMPEPATPEPATPEPATPEPATPEPAAAGPVTSATPPQPVSPAPAPPPAGRAEPVIGPVIAPILVGAPDAPPAPKKQGWWRR